MNTLLVYKKALNKIDKKQHYYYNIVKPIV